MNIIQVDTETSPEIFIRLLMSLIEDFRVLLITRAYAHEALIKRIIACKAGLSASDVQTGTLPPDELSRFTKASDWLRSKNLFFFQFGENPLETMKEDITKIRKKTSPDVVFIDKAGLDDVTLDFLLEYLSA